MGTISRQIAFILLFFSFITGCREDSIQILKDEYCLSRKSKRKIYHIVLTIKTIDNDSLVFTNIFTNKNNSNKFCFKSWKIEYDSKQLRNQENLIYNNCRYEVLTSFQDDRMHPPLVFTTDSTGNIILEK